MQSKYNPGIGFKARALVWGTIILTGLAGLVSSGGCSAEQLEINRRKQRQAWQNVVEERERKQVAREARINSPEYQKEIQALDQRNRMLFGVLTGGIIGGGLNKNPNNASVIGGLARGAQKGLKNEARNEAIRNSGADVNVQVNVPRPDYRQPAQRENPLRERLEDLNYQDGKITGNLSIQNYKQSAQGKISIPKIFAYSQCNDFDGDGVFGYPNEFIGLGNTFEKGHQLSIAFKSENPSEGDIIRIEHYPSRGRFNTTITGTLPLLSTKYLNFTKKMDQEGNSKFVFYLNGKFKQMIDIEITE